jgi:hypothetical protein
VLARRAKEGLASAGDLVAQQNPLMSMASRQLLEPLSDFLEELELKGGRVVQQLAEIISADHECAQLSARCHRGSPR